MKEVPMLLSKAMRVMNRGAVILSNERRVRVVAGTASQWLKEYFNVGEESHCESLPRELEEWVSQEQRFLRLHGAANQMSQPLEVAKGEKKLMVQLFPQQRAAVLLMEEKERKATPSAVLRRFGLTKREAEVLYWVGEGKTNTEIGVILALSARTVSKHLEHIYQKIGVETRTAAAFALAGKV